MFTIDTPRRCFGSLKDRRGIICAKPAIWMVEPNNGDVAQFFCDEHRRQNVVPIAADVPFRRVTLTVEVLLSATALTPAAAHSEAVELVNRALADVGGVFSLVNVTSAVGRYAVQPGQGGAKGRPGPG